MCKVAVLNAHQMQKYSINSRGIFDLPSTIEDKRVAKCTCSIKLICYQNRFMHYKTNYTANPKTIYDQFAVQSFTVTQIFHIN